MRNLAILALGITILSTFVSAQNGCQHYHLNIIGVQKEKNGDFDGNNGHRIFVDLRRNGGNASRINLYEGDSFKVLDANATGGSDASFQLPNPGDVAGGNPVYNVYFRALGKPGGGAKMLTCAYFENSDGTVEDVNEYCTNELDVTATKGKKTFQDASSQLLTVDIQNFIAEDGTVIDGVYNLFDDTLQDYYWEYDNNGLKLLQLRFVPAGCPIKGGGKGNLRFLENEN